MRRHLVAALAATVIAVGFTAPITAARADTSVDCSHRGSIFVGPIIFPPIACRADLDPGIYDLSLSWTLPTTGFVVLSVGDSDGNELVYFNTRVRAGLVTSYETDPGESYPPPKPKTRGPIAGSFTLSSPGTMTMTVFPEQVPSGGRAVSIPLGTFHLVISPSAG